MPIKSKKSRIGSKNVLKRTDIEINNNINNDNIVYHQSRYHQYCMRCTTVETTDYGYLNYDSNDDENYIEVLDSDDEEDKSDVIIEIEPNKVSKAFDKQTFLS